MNIIPENQYQEQMIRFVEPELETVHTIHQMTVKDGQLSVNRYLPEDMKAILLLLHGTTESAEKYHEMIWYFLQHGICVIAPDMRGHGKSLRQTDDPYLVHVDRFQDYVEDAVQITDTMLASYIGPKYLFGHSLGGAVAAALMLREPERFSRVVLSSPMVEPSCGSFPRWMGQLLADGNCLIGRGRKMAFVSGPYDPEKDTFETSCDTGRARFDYYKTKRIRDKDYQTSGLSYRWISESLKVKKFLLSHPNLQKVRSKVLLCQAGRDTVVCLPEQELFVKALPKAKRICYDEAKHEIYISDDGTMKRYVEAVCSFLMPEG